MVVWRGERLGAVGWGGEPEKPGGQAAKEVQWGVRDTPSKCRQVIVCHL